ncbi:MAG: hypothetical protein H7A50_17695 [Akkermansiaceae bacterium]|nr:hypothetical protein [Akkermansiaceae bacterium]
MSKQATSWFHCGRCGSLFESLPGDQADRRCGKCGFDPSLLARVIPPPPAPVAAEQPAEESAGPAPDEPRRHTRTVRKRKNRHLMLKLLAGWSLVLVLIVAGARVMWGDPREDRDTGPSTQSGNSISEADQALLNQAAPRCSEVLAGFLSAGGTEQQNQFVLHPVETIARMTRFYALNPLPKIDPESLEPGERTIFRIGETPVVEATFETSDGEIEVAFHQVDDEWRIDWEAFARYSEYPLALFLAGSGPDEAEFRLLARERLAEERKDEETLSLIFYAPRFGKPGETGTPSPEFLIARDTEAGRMISAALQAEQEDKRPFGAQIDPGDPDDMIRIRVRIRRSEVEGERKYEIVEVPACHWYESDLPGLEPAAAKAPAKD